MICCCFVVLANCCIAKGFLLCAQFDPDDFMRRLAQVESKLGRQVALHQKIQSELSKERDQIVRDLLKRAPGPHLPSAKSYPAAPSKLGGTNVNADQDLSSPYFKICL